MRISAIEIGTNSTKFIIGEQKGDDSFKVIEKTSTVNRLSRNMYDSNKISRDALENGVMIIGEYINRSERKDARLVSVFSTSVLRDAGNKEEFKKRVRDLYGIDIDVISGDREAYLAYKGCSSLFEDEDRFAVIDIGGGSTEITTGSKNSIYEKFSIDIGAVRLTQMFLGQNAVTCEGISNIFHYVNGKLDEAGDLELSGMKIIGTGGTIKSIGTILKKEEYWDDEFVHGMAVSISGVEYIYDFLAQCSQEEKMNIKGLNPKRADVITAGIIILLTLMKRFGLDHITISSRGVIEGFMEDYLSLNVGRGG